MSYHSETPDFISDFVDHAVAVLQKECGFTQVQAELASTELVNMVIRNWAGSIQYIPKGLSMQISTRDRQIYDDFNGNNHATLAKKYDISVQWVYRIIKRQRDIVIKEKQGDLFNG